MYFIDRTEAGLYLAARLSHLAGTDVVVQPKLPVLCQEKDRSCSELLGDRGEAVVGGGCRSFRAVEIGESV